MVVNVWFLENRCKFACSKLVNKKTSSGSNFLSTTDGMCCSIKENSGNIEETQFQSIFQSRISSLRERVFPDGIPWNYGSVRGLLRRSRPVQNRQGPLPSCFFINHSRHSTIPFITHLLRPRPVWVLPLQRGVNSGRNFRWPQLFPIQIISDSSWKTQDAKSQAPQNIYICLFVFLVLFKPIRRAVLYPSSRLKCRG